MTDHADTILSLREFADALDKDRGHSKSMVTRVMREAANQADALLAERRLLQEELRLREESQIPVIPKGAQQKIERLEAERQQAIDALRHIAKWQAETEADAEIVLLLQGCAAQALAKLGEQP